jgi:hypothetical protein
LHIERRVGQGEKKWREISRRPRDGGKPVNKFKELVHLLYI